MNILSIVDKNNSAIDILAKQNKKYLPHHNIEVVDLHPKRPSNEQLDRLEKAIERADVVDFQYWKSAELAKDLFPKINDLPSVLTHHNPYDTTKEKWSEKYDTVIVKNETQLEDLPTAHLIRHGVDMEFFTFSDEEPEEPVVNMVVGRIESKKGVLEVAQACKKLGVKMLLVGRISDRNYMNSVLENDNVEFRENVSEVELRDIYQRQATVHVCNSVDGFETGTLPILESMASGLPVLTRRVGLVPDLFNGKNAVVRDGEKEDVDQIADELDIMLKSKEKRNKIRNYAFDTIRRYDCRRAAYQYSKVWNDVWADKHTRSAPLTSVIIPTTGGDHLTECISSILVQNYGNIELIIVEDSQEPGHAKDVAEATSLQLRRGISPTGLKTVKYINTGKLDEKENGIAKARNLGAIESEGEYIIFCDDRLSLSSTAVHDFIHVLGAENKAVLWGVKDGAPKGFVENLSAIRRSEFIGCGMFCERINRYGGITQEYRTRLEKNQGFKFHRVDAVTAKSIKKSGSYWRKRKDIVNSKFQLWRMYGS